MKSTCGQTSSDLYSMLARLRLRPTSRVECSVHSRRRGLAHRRTAYDGQSRLACQVRSYSPSGDIALKGTHRLHSYRPRVNPWLEAFDALLPPRQRRVRCFVQKSNFQTKKLDSSSTNFQTQVVSYVRCQEAGQQTPSPGHRVCFRWSAQSSCHLRRAVGTGHTAAPAPSRQ
jgi:hypothetical protein